MVHKYEKAMSAGVSIFTAIAAGAAIIWSFWRESDRRNQNVRPMRNQAQCSTNPQGVSFQGGQNPAVGAQQQPDMNFGYQGNLRQNAAPPTRGNYSFILDSLRGASGAFSRIFKCIQAVINLFECTGRIFREEDYQYQSYFSNSPWGQCGQQNGFNTNPGEYQQMGKCAFRRINPFIVEAVPIGTPQSTPYPF